MSQSIPVEDLISHLANNLKANHIGQEANDLATLQTQLNQALRTSNRNQQHAGQHPNTPTQSLGAWAYPTDSSASVRHKPSHRTQRSRAHSVASDSTEMMLIDEEEVEELLQSEYTSQPHPTSPLYTNSSSPQFHQQQRLQSNIPLYASDTLPVSPSSSFAATDPFYATLSARNPYQSVHTHPANYIAPQTAFLTHPQPLHSNK